jgi:hypothetical protein
MGVRRSDVRFRIEYHAAPRTVFVRRLTTGDFAVPEGAMLGGVPLRARVTAPRCLKDGLPDGDVFAFELASRAELKLLPVGAEVALMAR